jgi:hypothetical protein
MLNSLSADGAMWNISNLGDVFKLKREKAAQWPPSLLFETRRDQFDLR